jgi:hypothetical protein
MSGYYEPPDLSCLLLKYFENSLELSIAKVGIIQTKLLCLDVVLRITKRMQFSCVECFLKQFIMIIQNSYLVKGLMLLGGLLLQACHPIVDTIEKKIAEPKAENSNEQQFATYWYNGEAEICTYQVTQNRYGETRVGQEVLVFVTEDFSKSKHVKLDDPDKNWRDKVSVLKLNRIRRFVTGIYDYSLMQSVFTPVLTKENAYTLKVTTTVQDWCGQTYNQLNFRRGKYEVQNYSYFEKEGDERYKLNGALLEDEILNRIRINPGSLPSNEVYVIQGTFSSRLSHEPLKARKARIKVENREAMSYLTIEYLHLDRTIRIGYETYFPHKILYWEEIQNGTTVSKGTLQKFLKSAYWKENSSRYEYLRDSLQLH